MNIHVMPCQYTDITILRVFKCMFFEICTTTCMYMCNFNIPTVLFWLFCWTVIKCTFCIYIRKRLYCPCSRTENKFNVFLMIDSDNGLGVPPRTNKTNKAWRSARVQRSLLFKVSSEDFFQLRGTPRTFVNDQNNVLLNCTKIGNSNLGEKIIIFLKLFRFS